MSIKYRNSQGVETLVAGTSPSGELVPSVTYIQSGTVTFSCGADSWTTVDVTFATPMPDTDYLVVTDSGETAYVHVQNATTKRTTGFTMIIWNRDAVSNTGIIRWTAFKPITDEQVRLDEGQIEQNASDISAINSKIPSTASSTEKLAYVEYVPSTSLYSTWEELLELLHQKGNGYWTGTIYIVKWYTYTARIVSGTSGYWYGSFLAKCAETEDLVGASKIYGSTNTWTVTHYVTESNLAIKKVDISAIGGATSFSATIPLSMAQRNKPFYLEVLSVGNNNAIKEMKYLVFVSSMTTIVTTKEISKDVNFTDVSLTFNASTGYELSFSSTDTLYSTTVYTQQ